MQQVYVSCTFSFEFYIIEVFSFLLRPSSLLEYIYLISKFHKLRDG